MPECISFRLCFMHDTRFLTFSRRRTLVEQVPDDLREGLHVGDAPEFEMLRMGGVFMQSDEVRGYGTPTACC